MKSYGQTGTGGTLVDRHVPLTTRRSGGDAIAQLERAHVHVSPIRQGPAVDPDAVARLKRLGVLIETEPQVLVRKTSRKPEPARPRAARPASAPGRPGPEPVSKVRLRQVLELHRLGQSVETIAETVGWTRQTVRRHLVAAGFDLPAQPRGPRPAFDVDQAVEQAQAGMTVTQIARHHQVSVRTITSHLERRGVTPVNGRTAAALARSQHIDTDAIVKAYAAGASIPQVADQLGCATATVRRRLISAGVILRDDRHTNSGGRNQISAQTAQAAIDLYLSGLTGKEVGRRLGIGQTTVGRILRDHDITVRTSGQAQLGRVGRDNARDLKDLMAANGATTQDVRAWARRTGRPVADRGIPGRHLVEDYLLEHSRNPNHTKENRP